MVNTWAEVLSSRHVTGDNRTITKKEWIAASKSHRCRWHGQYTHGALNPAPMAKGVIYDDDLESLYRES
jgi:hypothetical protein